MHVREHRSVTAAMEKRLLVWIAARLPSWTTPDQLTAGGLAAMALAGTGFAALRATPTGAALVVSGLVLNWLCDSLDGTLARVRCQQRPRYGYYVDHVVDVAGTTMLLGGLAVSERMHPLLAIAVLAAYLAVCAETFLATHALGVFTLSFAGFGPTELRIALAVGAAAVARDAWITAGPLGRLRLFDVGGVVAVTGLTFVFLNRAVRRTRALAAAERVRPGHAA
jgi:phosphatidylglycerophosphate synthase